MPFVERNKKKEQELLKQLINNSDEAKKAHEEFEREYEFRKALIKARKSENITQKQLSERTGLTQQVISKIETGKSNTTLETLRKYLNGIGYDLKLNRIL